MSQASDDDGAAVATLRAIETRLQETLQVVARLKGEKDVNYEEAALVAILDEVASVKRRLEELPEAEEAVVKNKTTKKRSRKAVPSPEKEEEDGTRSSGRRAEKTGSARRRHRGQSLRLSGTRRSRGHGSLYTGPIDGGVYVCGRGRVHGGRSDAGPSGGGGEPCCARRQRRLACLSQ